MTDAAFDVEGRTYPAPLQSATSVGQDRFAGQIEAAQAKSSGLSSIGVPWGVRSAARSQASR
jgi:hypothetical protein